MVMFDLINLDDYVNVLLVKDRISDMLLYDKHVYNI